MSCNSFILSFNLSSSSFVRSLILPYLVVPGASSMMYLANFLNSSSFFRLGSSSFNVVSKFFSYYLAARKRAISSTNFASFLALFMKKIEVKFAMVNAGLQINLDLDSMQVGICVP